MHDHPLPGPVWVPELLRGMLSEFGREVEQEAFAELQFRLPALPPGDAPHGVRFESPGGSAPRFAFSGPAHPGGLGSAARSRESHVR